MKKQILAALGLLSFFILSGNPVHAQGFSDERMNAVQATEQVLVAGSDVDGYIDTWLEASYRSSMSRNAMRDHIQLMRQAVSNAGGLDLEAEPDAVHLIFSEGANATISIQFAPAGSALISHIGFREQKSVSEMTESERFAAARRTRMRAIEAIGNARQAYQFESFLANHVTPGFLQSVNKETLLNELRTLQKVIAQCDIIQVDQMGEETRLAFRGPGNADVTYTLSPDAPYLISSMHIDLNVDVSEEERASVTIDPITWDNLEQRLMQESQAGFSGVVLAIRDGEVVLKKGFGYAHREAGRMNSPSTIFGLGSIPIDFTIAAILKLVDDGKIALADPINTYFSGVPSDKESMTIQHLMSGRSGLPNFHHNPEVDNDYDLSWIDRDEAIGRILDQPLLFAPGSGDAPSHSAFVLLAALVEVVSKTSYQDFLRTSFFNPMGMADTGFYGETDRFTAERFAVGYGMRRVGEPNIPLQWGPTSWLIMGSGGMFSTIDDLYKWIRHIRSGDYLSTEALKTYGSSGVASGISDRGFMVTYINDPNQTLIYLTNTIETDGDLSHTLGLELIQMVLETKNE